MDSSDERQDAVSQAFEEWRLIDRDQRTFLRLGLRFATDAYDRLWGESGEEPYYEGGPDQLESFEEKVGGLHQNDFDWILLSSVLRDTVTNFEVYLEKAREELLAHDGQPVEIADRSPDWCPLKSFFRQFGVEIETDEVRRVRAMRHFLSHRRGELRTEKLRKEFQATHTDVFAPWTVELSEALVIEAMDALANAVRSIDRAVYQYSWGSWATHGSKLQTQLYVNRWPETLTEKVLEALPTLAAHRAEIAWVVPLEAKRFAEPRDRSMLAALELDRLAAELARFWPARGPVWDALAICRFPDGTSGRLLAEGKNYPREMYGGGSGAGKAGSDASLESRRQIERAVAWVQGRIGVPLDVRRWLDPLVQGEPSLSLYPTANRLAYAVWLRSQGIETWLCHLLFVDDPLHHPTSREEWERGLETADRELGIEGIEIPFAGHAFLDALDPARELAERRGPPAAS